MNNQVPTHLDKESGLTIPTSILFFLAVILPVLLPFVRRATPVVLGIATLLAVIYLFQQAGRRKKLYQLARPATFLGLAFLIWAGVTCFWAPVPSRSWQAVFSGAFVFACANILRVVPLPSDRRILDGTSLSIALASLIIVLDLEAGGQLLHLIHSRPEPYRYNMVVVSLVALSFGMFSRGLSLSQPIKYLAVLILVAAAFVSESETSKLALIVGYFSMVSSTLLPRRFSLMSSIVCLIFVWVVSLLRSDLLQNAADFWPSLAEHGHAAQRVQIWVAYSKMAIAGLPLGWGVESVAHVPMTSYFATVVEPLRVHLEWLHPHNNAIQIAVEMGLPGIFLGFIGCLFLLFWAHADEKLRPARVGLISATIVVALVSHGFWQMWWWSAVAISIWLLQSNRGEA